jgi:hypothetical protein
MLADLRQMLEARGFAEGSNAAPATTWSRRHSSRDNSDS